MTQLPLTGFQPELPPLEAPKGPNVVAAEEIVEEALVVKLKGVSSNWMHADLIRAVAKELAVHLVACLDEVLLIAPDLVEQEHGETCSCQTCVGYHR